MTTEHLNEAIKDYFIRFAYVQPDEYFKLKHLKFEKDNMVFVSGEITDNG